MTATVVSGELATPRPARASIAEIFVLSLTWLVLLQIVATVPGSDFDQVAERAAAAGRVVLEHIGWGFGVMVPILLGFYAIVVGGQLAGTARAAKTQRDLGLVAEAMVSTLVPALVVIVVACIGQPQLVGSIFVIVPASAVTLFLAVQLGGFIVFERDAILAAAARSQIAAASILENLRLRSRRPVWIVSLVNAIAAICVAIGIDATWGDYSFVARPAYLAAMISLVTLVMGACLFAVTVIRSTTDQILKATGWVLAVSVSLIALSAAMGAAVLWGISTAVGLFVAVALVNVSSLWPRRTGNLTMLNWTIQGAGCRQAAKSAARSYARATRTISEYRVDPAEPSRPSLRERLRSAAGAWASPS